MSESADFIFKGDVIFTGLKSEPEEGFVAVKGQKILATGGPGSCDQWIGYDTQIVDCHDQMILPGFFDSHVHINMGFFAAKSADLSGSRTEEDAARILFEEYSDSKDGQWVTGFGWNHAYWENQIEPCRKTLDKYFPDRPVLCVNDEVHAAWVNSKTLDICGIDRGTADPPGGIIARDENNEPTGFLLETALNSVLNKMFSSIPPESFSAGIEDLLKSVSEYGVTSVADMQISRFDNDIFGELEARDRLPIRVHLYPYLYSSEDQEQQWSYVKSVYTAFKSDMLRAVGVKIFCDGTVLGHTGLMIEPYSDAPDIRGMTLHGERETGRIMIEAASRGYNVRAHACGDGAVRLALDAFEAATHVSNWKNLRHAIEHIEVVSPQDLHRFKKLNVTASIQPEHMEIDPEVGSNPYDEIVGSQRKKYLWNFRSLSDSGCRLAFGTDMPIVDINPFINIYRAVSRRNNDGYPANGWFPEEKLTLAQALKAYTLDSAWLNSRDHDLGSLEAGKFADIIVLDRNLFDIPEEEIKNTKTVLTMVGGKIIHHSGD